jgi:hypothetical protein
MLFPGKQHVDVDVDVEARTLASDVIDMALLHARCDLALASTPRAVRLT